MYTIEYSNYFKKALRKCFKRGLDVEKLREVVHKLERGESLPEKCRVHKITGTYAGAWECHIEPDWLLVWEQDDTRLILLMIDTGTHSDIFG